MLNIEEYKQFLIDAIESTAHWRSEKSDEYPEDNRNIGSSRALTNLGTSLAMLPDNNPSLMKLWRQECDAGDDHGLYHSEILSETLRRYGVHDGGGGDAESFLVDLADELADE